MNIEEIDKWLDNEYGCSYTRLEELHDFLIDRNMKYQDEIERYKNIVDELEKFINNRNYWVCELGDEEYIPLQFIQVKLIQDKLKELKGE